MPEIDWLAPLRGLLDVFSPAEAEAKVVARDPQAQALINAVASGATMPEGQEKDPLLEGYMDPVRRQLYQEVLRTAQARPETASVSVTKNMPGKAGEYDPNTGDVRISAYDPFYSKTGKRYTEMIPTAVNYQDTLAHELLHFLLPHISRDITSTGGARSWDPLMQKLGLERTIGQHAFINYALGQDYAHMEKGPTGQQQPWLMGYEASPLFRIKGDPPHSELQDVYAEALRRIIQDPTLLKQALQGFQRGQR